jgi:hypothetical protein
MKWGRNESVIWPPHGPINTWGAMFLAFVCTCLFIYLRFIFGLTPLQQFYLPYYLRAEAVGMIHKTDKYQLVTVLYPGEKRSRIAMESDVIPGSTPQILGKPLPLQISPQAIKGGGIYLIRQQKTEYSNKSMISYFRDTIYGGAGILDLFSTPLLLGLASLLLQLPFSIAADVTRRKQLRYGRRLRGPERLDPPQFNKTVKGDGVGIVTDGMKEMLRIPAKAEAQHIQVIGDTGAGKTTIIFQLLRQIQARGDSAIIYDPALEFTKRFLDQSRGDVILNPLDKRCPYWGPSEELIRPSEADAIAASLFQPREDKKGEFFTEIPQQVFSHLLKYGPTPTELIEWMSNPAEIDNRVARTEVANFIDRAAGPQRIGVLASLSKVAKSLRLLPTHEEGNGEWSATSWSETREGWIFITSLPAEREALRPLQSVWIDMLILRLLSEPKPGQKRVWFVLDELASLQRLPQLTTALTENRKSNNPIILGFQGKAQLEVIYGHMAEVMLSQPSTSIWLKTKEPKAGKWISEAIGNIEVERMKETHFNGSRSGANFSLDRQTEPLVLESEISGLPDRHAFMKYGNYVTGFSFPYLDVMPTPDGLRETIPFEPRDIDNGRLVYDPPPVKSGRASATPSPFADPDQPLEPAAPAAKTSRKRAKAVEAITDSSALHFADEAGQDEPPAVTAIVW